MLKTAMILLFPINYIVCQICFVVSFLLCWISGDLLLSANRIIGLNCLEWLNNYVLDFFSLFMNYTQLVNEKRLSNTFIINMLLR